MINKRLRVEERDSSPRVYGREVHTHLIRRNLFVLHMTPIVRRDKRSACVFTIFFSFFVKYEIRIENINSRT